MIKLLNIYKFIEFDSLVIYLDLTLKFEYLFELFVELVYGILWD